ncbi:5840_t:CDS:1, partial [Cetraspora pellucida]
SSMRLKRCRKFGSEFLEIFEQQAKKAFYAEENIILEELVFSVGSKRFRINYKEPNKEKNNLKEQAIIQAMDMNKISRESYRALASIEYSLPREWSISNMRQQLTD